MTTNQAMTVAAALATVPALVASATEEQSCPVLPMPQQYEVSPIRTVKAASVSVQLRTPESAGGLWDRLPSDVAEAYAISISPEGQVQIAANDETGLFYAKQTLSQMLVKVPGARTAQKDPFPELSIEQVAELGELPTGTVVDWPSLRYRGAVEGYYGIPWSYEGRRSLFDFYGRNKMNIYIYAPKDDPLHHGKGCYEPYPEAKAHELAALVQHARRNHVRFVWAIHPANTVKWHENGGRNQLDALCTKLQWMYNLGVRDFGVLVDDSFGEIGQPARQVQLCNYILENFIRKHDAISDVAVIGLPDARLGEIAAAIVQVKEGCELTEEQFNEFCLDLPRYKRPRRVIFAEVPRNPTGKIEKPVLREKYCKGRLVEAQITG